MDEATIIQGASQQVLHFQVTFFFFFKKETNSVTLQSFSFLGVDKTLDFCWKPDYHLFIYFFLP